MIESNMFWTSFFIKLLFINCSSIKKNRAMGYKNTPAVSLGYTSRRSTPLAAHTRDPIPNMSYGMRLRGWGSRGGNARAPCTAIRKFAMSRSESIIVIIQFCSGTRASRQCAWAVRRHAHLFFKWTRHSSAAAAWEFGAWLTASEEIAISSSGF
jgi:hypothetical protein